MFDFSNLLEFSHNHCIAICAALVPANVLTTFCAIVFVWLQRPTAQVWQLSGLASCFALLMVLHVLTWFVIGVVMLPTFVLLSLGGVCLSINVWVILHPQSLRHFLSNLAHRMGNLRTKTASLS